MLCNQCESWKIEVIHHLHPNCLLSIWHENNSDYFASSFLRNLLALDSDGLSDPYVRAYLLPEKSRSSRRRTDVKKNTLDPKFDETYGVIYCTKISITSLGKCPDSSTPAQISWYRSCISSLLWHSLILEWVIPKPTAILCVHVCLYFMVICCSFVVLNGMSQRISSWNVLWISQSRMMFLSSPRAKLPWDRYEEKIWYDFSLAK